MRAYADPTLISQLAEAIAMQAQVRERPRPDSWYAKPRHKDGPTIAAQLRAALRSYANAAGYLPLGLYGRLARQFCTNQQYVATVANRAGLSVRPRRKYQTGQNRPKEEQP